MGKTLQECYEVLGVDSSATEDEIKSAYRQRALKCHPDKNPDDPLSTQKFQELGHAYRRVMGDEDSDDDEEDYGDEDDMDLWRDFFFFLFRDEILARVRCKCDRCGRRGDEDDEFLASLAKEQEERKQFTEEEMAQFTKFANLKEQREANKQKFCNKQQKNLSSSKPEEKANKGHKTKLKSNKQLKHEQWKREKEISEIAAQIQQNPQVLEKKASSRAPKKEDLQQEKSSDQPAVVNPKHIAKEQTEHGASNKRNMRKKRNRNKSTKLADQEKVLHQNDNHRDTTLAGHKVASSFVTQDAMRNVTIKPETTRRQDDVTGRLPRHTGHSSPRMKQSWVKNSAYSSHKSAFPKQTEKQWFETTKPEAGSRPTHSANIWEKRQKKQQFLAEIQPCDQTDEELQLQMALELSKKQAEIDAQKREINILEKQMEETLQIEKDLQIKTFKQKPGSKTVSTTETTNIAVSLDPDSFPPLGDPRVYHKGSDAEEEWVVASESEEEWGTCDCDNESDDDDESRGCLAKHSDPEDERASGESAVSSGVGKRGDMVTPKPNVQLHQQSRREDSQVSDCPYGKNCCLGKRCKYSHPPSIDNRKRKKSTDSNCGSQVQGDVKRSERSVEGNVVHDHLGKQSAISPVSSCGELPKSDTSDVSYRVDGGGCSKNTSPCDFDRSMENHSLQASETQTSKTHLSKKSIQSNSASGEHENLNQPLRNSTAGLESQSFTRDSSSSTQEKHETYSSEALSVDDPVEGFKMRSDVSCETSPPEDEKDLTGESAPIPSFPADSPASSDLIQSSTNMPQLTSQSVSASSLCQSTKTVPQLTNLSLATSVQSQSANAVPQLTNLSSTPSALKQSAATMPQLTNTSPAVSYLNQSAKTVPQFSNLSSHDSAGSQSATALSQLTNLSTDERPQNSSQTSQPAATPTNVIPPTSAPGPQSPRHAVTISETGTSQNSTRLSSGNTQQTSATSQQPTTLDSSIPAQSVATNNFPAIPGFSFLPFGNLFPFVNPANADMFNPNVNANLMAAASLGGVPFPVMPGVQNAQGVGAVMNQAVPPPYCTSSGISPPGHFLPVAPLNGFSGVSVGASKPGVGPQPSQPSHAGLSTDPHSTEPGRPQMYRVSGKPVGANIAGIGAGQLSKAGLATDPQSLAVSVPEMATRAGMSTGDTMQPSQAGLATNPHSKLPAMQQLNVVSGVPAGANMLREGVVQPSNTGLTTYPQSSASSMPQLPLNGFSGMPFGTSMSGSAAAQSTIGGLTADPQSATLNVPQLLRFPFPLVNPQAIVNMNVNMAAMRMPCLPSKQGRQTTVSGESTSSQVEVNGKPNKREKPVEAKLDVGDGREASGGVGTKAPSLRRPATMPKVIQHQASIQSELQT